MSLRLKRYVRAVGAFRIAAKSSVSTSAGREGVPSTLALGLEGFDELRRYIKQGCELCKEVAIIAAERSDLETFYSRGLQRLSTKLAKACGAGAGTIAAAWGATAVEMQHESEAHRTVAVSLLEDICKPLRVLAETQSKDRKPIEQAVDKATRDMVDKKAEESKFKQKMFTYTQESESLHEQINQSRLNKEKEKEITKMEKRLQMLKDHARKSGKQYYDACVAAELAREEWDAALLKGSRDLRDMEAERLKELHKHLKVYKGQVESLAPVLAQVCEKLKQATDSIDFEKDLTAALEGRGYCLTVTEQLLFESYAENMESSMSKERRRQTLNLYIYYLSQDVDKERKTKLGMERLVEIYAAKPTFTTLDAQEDVKAKLKQTCAFLNFLDASHFKLSCTLATINDLSKPVYMHERYMEVIRDKMGLRQTVLRLPVGLVTEAFDPDVYSARGAGDGSTIPEHHYSLAHDEDYSDGMGTQGAPAGKGAAPASIDSVDEDAFTEYDFDSCDFADSKPISTCRVLYDYTATNSTELTVKKGDTVQIHEKHSDGWWYGELNGGWGVFPASYAQELGAFDEATSSTSSTAADAVAAEKQQQKQRSDALGEEGSPKTAPAAIRQRPSVSPKPPRPAAGPPATAAAAWGGRTVQVKAAVESTSLRDSEPAESSTAAAAACAAAAGRGLRKPSPDANGS